MWFLPFILLYILLVTCFVIDRIADSLSVFQNLSKIFDNSILRFSAVFCHSLCRYSSHFRTYFRRTSYPSCSKVILCKHGILFLKRFIQKIKISSVCEHFSNLSTQKNCCKLCFGYAFIKGISFRIIPEVQSTVARQQFRNSSHSYPLF